MNEVIWRGRELAGLFNAPAFQTDVAGVSIDSRTIKEGDLFIALDGGARDGHDFVADAVQKGAAAIMAHRDVATSVGVIHVDDTLGGLWRLGGAARKRMGGSVLAVTGSSGKTTFRSWLESLLRKLGPTHASVESFNNHLGLPLSLSRMPAGSEYGVFEVGTNKPGEIAPLAELANPDVAVLLNVLPAHIGHFSGMDALRQEKLSISTGLQPGGVLVLPAQLAPLATHDRRLTFAASGPADVTAKVSVAGTDSILEVSAAGHALSVTLPFVGAERVESALAAVAALIALGIDPASLADAFQDLSLPPGRGNRIDIAGITIIDDSYNANPVSMAMALRHLGAMGNKGKKIAVLGEMLELGRASGQAHARLGEIATADRLLTVGDGFAPVMFKHAHRHYAHVDDLDVQAFAASLAPGDLVLVKGGNKVFWQKSFVRRLVSAIDRALIDR